MRKLFNIMQRIIERKSVADFASERERLIAELHQLNAAMRLEKMHGAGPLMDLDLTIPQLRVLFLLAESEHMSMGRTAHELGITLPACTHLVDRLVRAGYVARNDDPDDRRVVRCALTDAGRALVERTLQSFPFQRQEFLDRLTVEELRVIVQAMGVFKRVMAEIHVEQARALPGDSPYSGVR